jgi:hypothetical protein
MAAGDLKCRMQSGGLSRFGLQEPEWDSLNTKDHVFSELRGFFGRKIVDLEFIEVILSMTTLEKSVGWQTERRAVSKTRAEWT